MRRNFKNKEFKMKDKNKINRFYIEPESKGGRKCEAEYKIRA